MNKKKAKVLIIGKGKLIKVTQHQENRLWFNRMPKRITNSVATITWYVFDEIDSRRINLLQNHSLC